MGITQVADPLMSTALDQLCINTFERFRSMWCSRSTPGIPARRWRAPFIYTIWNRPMRFDPQHPIWSNRDRFRSLQWPRLDASRSMLHLTRTQAANADYEVLGRPSVSPRRHSPLPPILDSKTPGRPSTTGLPALDDDGPLGQGVATSVGMAIAQKWLVPSHHTDRQESKMKL